MKLIDIIAPFESGIVRRACDDALSRYEGNDAEEATGLVVDKVTRRVVRSRVLQTMAAVTAGMLVGSYAPDIHILPAWMEPEMYKAISSIMIVYGSFQGMRAATHFIGRKTGYMQKALLPDIQEYINDRNHDEASSQEESE